MSASAGSEPSIQSWLASFSDNCTMPRARTLRWRRFCLPAATSLPKRVYYCMRLELIGTCGRGSCMPPHRAGMPRCHCHGLTTVLRVGGGGKCSGRHQLKCACRWRAAQPWRASWTCMRTHHAHAKCGAGRGPIPASALPTVWCRSGLGATGSTTPACGAATARQTGGERGAAAKEAGELAPTAPRCSCARMHHCTL